MTLGKHHIIRTRESRNQFRKDLCLTISLSLLTLILVSNRPREPRRSVRNAKPNILLVITDDQQYKALGALGGKEIITPHLDSLARAGTSFSSAFNMGAWNGAVCGASRTMFLTGLPVWKAERSEKDLVKMVATGSLWVQQLHEAGYETYMSGKWGVKADAKKVFDHVVNERPGPEQTAEGYNRPQAPDDTLWTSWNEKFGGFWKGGKHWSEVLADDGIKIIEEASKKDNPFLVYLSFHAPHDPRQAPKRFLDLYPLDKISLPRSYSDNYIYKEQIGAGINSRDEKLAPFPRTAYAVRKNIQEYYAIISHLDEQVGKILYALKKYGSAEKTYVFFVSDHGLAVGHHGLMGKQNMFDHSIRVPLIVAGPGIPEGEVRDQQVYLQDIMATIYELAGTRIPESVYFKSLLTSIRSKRALPYPEIYAGYIDLQRMVRTSRYKLIVYPKVPKVLLFDLKDDPDEMNDVSGVKGYANVLADMEARLIKQQQIMNDTLDLKAILK